MMFAKSFAEQLREKSNGSDEEQFHHCLARARRACQIAAEDGRFQSKVFIHDKTVQKAVALALKNSGLVVEMKAVALEMYW